MESLVFSVGKLTLLGGRELTLPPKFCLFDVQNCTLNHSRCQLSAFCREPWCSPDCSRARISGIKRSKLALCVVICGHTVAKAASYEVKDRTNSDFIPHVVPKNGIISCSLGKLTLLGGHELTLPPNFCLFEVQNCTLNHSRG